MTYPDFSSIAKALLALQDLNIQRLASGLIAMSLSVAFAFHIGRTQAQNITDLDWQPGQAILPTIISTPHEDVQKMLRQAKYAQAMLLVDKALTRNPRDPQMRFWQSFIFHQRGQTDQALQGYLALTQEYPELAEPHNNLGVIYASQGDYPKAQASLEAALRANPNYASAHENMGDLLVNLARLAYQQALTIAPEQRQPAQKIELLKPLLTLTQSKP